MKKIFIGFGSVVMAVLLFAGGVCANENGWLDFTGDEQISQASKDVADIMDILESVAQGRDLAEKEVERLNELITDLPEGTTPSGLAKQNQKLRDQVAELEGTITLRDNTIDGLDKQVAHLNSELERANSAVSNHSQTVTKALDKARTFQENGEQ